MLSQSFICVSNDKEIFIFQRPIIRIFCVHSYSFDDDKMPNCVNNKLLEIMYQATLCKVTLCFQWLSFKCAAFAAFIHLHFNKDEWIRGKWAKYVFNECHRRNKPVEFLSFKWEVAKNLVLHMHKYPSILTAYCVLPNSESFLVVAPGTAVVGTGVMRE